METLDFSTIGAIEEKIVAILKEALPYWTVVGSHLPARLATRSGIRRLPEARVLHEGLREDGTIQWTVELAQGDARGDGFRRHGPTGVYQAVRDALTALEQTMDIHARVINTRRRDSEPGVAILELSIETSWSPPGAIKQGVYKELFPLVELTAAAPPGSTMLESFTALNPIPETMHLALMEGDRQISLGAASHGEGSLLLEQPLPIALDEGAVIHVLGEGVTFPVPLNESRETRVTDWARRGRDLEGGRHLVLLGPSRERVRWSTVAGSAGIGRKILEFLGMEGEWPTLVVVLRDGTLREGTVESIRLGNSREGMSIDLDVGPILNAEAFLPEEPS